MSLVFCVWFGTGLEYWFSIDLVALQKNMGSGSSLLGRESQRAVSEWPILNALAPDVFTGTCHANCVFLWEPS